MYGDPVQKSAKILDIPEDAIAKRIRVEIVGFSLIEVSGYDRIIEYSRECVRFQLKNEIITINGEEIVMKSLENGDAILRGKINSVTDEA